MLRTRLFFGLLPLLLLIIAVGGYAIHVCHQLAGPLQRDLVAHYRTTIGCQELRGAAVRMSNAALAGLEGDPLTARRQLDAARSDFVRELMNQSASSAGRPRAGLVAALDDAFQDFSARCDRAAAGGGAALGDFRTNQDALYRVFTRLDALTSHDLAASQATEAQAEHLGTTAVRILSIEIGAGIALAAILAWGLAASLLRPIKALTASATALGEGDLDVRVPEFSRDELGRLGRSFNTMAEHLRDYRAAMQARVLRTQRTMEATLTAATDPLFLVAARGEIEARNPAAEELSGLPEFAAGLPPALAEPLAAVLATEEPYLPADYRRVVTFRVGREDRHYLPRILAIGDRLSEFKGAAVILQDVTKFRLLDDAKTNLVGTVSHELKTPLTGLRMAVYLLLERTLGPLSPGQVEMLESARDDADRLLRILDSLLDLTRLEAGASALDRRPLAPVDLVEAVAAEARGFIGAAQQQLEVRCEPGLGELSVDPVRLRHVFINLLTNASKYSPAGAVITLAATAAPLGYVRFSVQDQGEGIPAESIPYVFDRFYRVPGQSQPGAGIGLAITREIVIAHGGSIGCARRERGGMDFHFLIPTLPAAG